MTFDDVRGSIKRPVSFWAIDESGVPSRKPNENGKAFTLSAVTELSTIDYDRLLANVPLDDDRVHFSTLRNKHPDICIRLMTDFGKENVLIVSLSVNKRSKYVDKVKGIPIDELYLSALLQRLLEAICEIDLSDSIIATYEANVNIREEQCLLLWTDRCTVVLDKPQAFKLLQLADLSAGSIGKSLLPEPYSDGRYYDTIRPKTVDISRELGRCTQQLPSPPNCKDVKPGYNRFAGFDKQRIAKRHKGRYRNEKQQM